MKCLQGERGDKLTVLKDWSHPGVPSYTGHGHELDPLQRWAHQRPVEKAIPGRSAPSQDLRGGPAPVAGTRPQTGPARPPVPAAHDADPFPPSKRSLDPPASCVGGTPAAW